MKLTLEQKILTILVEAERPLTTREICQRIDERWNQATPTPKFIRTK